ncbi:Prokineticin receptor 2 [Bienertia sinuspersici]
MLMGFVTIQSIMDLAVAGISLMIGLGIFAFIASVLCSAAFFQHAKDVSG